MTDPVDIRLGVLALQGDFERHEHQMRLAGVTPAQVRLPQHLERLDGLVLPGGESTTMNHLIDRYGLREPLRAFCTARPAWGTCAGMIMLARTVVDNQAGVRPLGLVDIDVRRVGYGRQVYSTRERIAVSLNGRPIELTVAFIRAPMVTRVGKEVTVLGSYLDTPVLLSQGRILVSSFHTELGDDTTLLRYFIGSFVVPERAKRGGDA